MMDVPADNAFHGAVARLGGDGFTKGGDVLHRVLDTPLEVSGERPVRIAEPAPHRVEMTVQPNCCGVGAITEQRQPTGVHHHGVEHVAVQHEQAAAVGGDMDCVLYYFDTAELQLR